MVLLDRIERFDAPATLEPLSAWSRCSTELTDVVKSGPLKLLVTTSDFVGRGAERELANLLHRLPRDRFDCRLALWRDVFDYPVPRDIPITILEKRRPWDIFRVITRLRSLLRDWQPDLLFSQLNYVSTVTGAAVSGLRDRPAWIVRLAGNPRVEIRHPVLAWTRRSLRHADVVAGCCDSVSESIISHLRISHERVGTLENVIDVDQIERRAGERVEIDRADGSFVFVHAGRLVPQKHQELLLHALAGLDRSVHLWMLGTGPRESELRSLTKQLDLEDRVRWFGFQENPHGIIGRADAFVLCSRYEGMPNALIEAMICGKPVISTRCDYGPGDVIEEGRSGLLTPVGDAGALRQAMASLAGDRANAREMGERARLAMRSRFDPAHVVDDYVRFFESTVHRVLRGNR